MQSIRWKKLGEGGYNRVYKSADGKLVFKVQLDKGDKTDKPERSVELWNRINSHLPPPAKVINHPTLGKGWVCPFVKGKQATDAAMCRELINIFNNTGRIITDAVAKNNFVTTPKGQTICIDIGMALQMEEREDAYFESAVRRKSVVSLETWADIQGKYDPFFKEYSDIYPDTVKTIKALLFIKSTRPDIYDASFLKDNQQVITSLAKAYDDRDHNNFVGKKRAVYTLDHRPEIFLKEQRAVKFSTIRESCKRELELYIKSRGTIQNDKFTPGRSVRNVDLVSEKVRHAQSVIARIDEAKTLEQIDQIIKESQQDSRLMKTNIFRKGLASRLGACMLILQVAHKQGLNFKETFEADQKAAASLKLGRAS